MPIATVNGVELRYEERGDGDPVLFLHGTGASRFVWERALEEMPQRWRLIDYDRRGFGESRGARARRLGDHADDAAALLDELGARPAAIVTQSGGAPVAFQIAISHPRLVSRLVIAEPAYRVGLHPSLSVSAAMTKTLTKWLVGRDREGAAESYYRWATRLKSGSNAYEGYPRAWKEVARRHARATLWEILQLIPPWPRASDVRRISCPITLVLGDLGQPVFHRTTRSTHRLLPHAKLVHVEQTSHLIPPDQPQAFARVLTDALTDGG